MNKTPAQELSDLREYLEWLISPQNEQESQKFKDEGLVDDYLELKDKIPTLSKEELLSEINIQLKPYSVECK